MIDQRRALLEALGPITYADDLPVVAAKDEIAAAIRDHQVVVIAGQTGSGKTTQIPKICLDLGRGLTGMIGHTQPRRIAARAVAERIATELGTELGGVVGYQVRFADHSSKNSLVKVMTDGILLAELARDRDLRRYDTIIIDEAHERSLNIDFLLGYLHQLLPRRPDLKVIITSATIDPGAFAAHFATADRPVPVIEVSGRTYPVEVRYRPLLDPDSGEERDQVSAICDAVTELWTESHVDDGGGHDILVFLSGEREIRDAAEGLAGLQLPQTEILPLFARLSSAEQHRVFAPHPGRRIVLATNVAETSLTVPGIRYVVDTGTARISRYSQRTKVQRLPIEPISQASAAQRSGRCGRLADGICVRLYAEDDFAARAEFTDPEILRTNLASVILQMTSLGLGDVARFPFLDPPDSRNIADGIRLLEELRAFTAADAPRGTDSRRRGRARSRLTPIGRTIAALPVDPRLARMVIEADRLGVLPDVLVVAAAMSIQDPRERPLERAELANAAHKRFVDETSDIITMITLWEYLREQQRERSGSAFRRMCKAEFLHYLRIREWQDLVSQLRQAAKQAGMDVSRGRRRGETPPDADAIHKAVLAGLLSHVGVRDEVKREYAGARGARFAISPGSALFRKQPSVVMAAELVETTRLWARTCARIDPVWAEELGEHLVKRSYSEPRWSSRQGAALATERVTLFGVPLVVGRTVGLARVDPALARELFIRHALVEGDWSTRHTFFHDNARLIERLGEFEAMVRRRDLLAGEDALVAFYDKRIPAEVVSARHFDSWWKRASRQTPDLLTFTEDLLLAGQETASGFDYPPRWQHGALEFPLTYVFEPGSPEDGVAVTIGLDVLNQVSAAGFDWNVPGLRVDLVTALIRALPKDIRRHYVPAPQVAADIVGLLDPTRGALRAEVARVLQARGPALVNPTDFDVDRVPPHLRMTFRIVDAQQNLLAAGKDLDDLRESVGGALRRRVSRVASSLERTGLTGWTIGTLPSQVDLPGAQPDSPSLQGFPALVDEGSTVSLRVLPTAAEAAAEHRLGVRRLILLGVNPPWRHVLASLTNAEKLALGHNPHGGIPALLDDALAAAVDAIVARAAGPGPDAAVRDQESFEVALSDVRNHLSAEVLRVVRAVEPILARHLRITNRLDAMSAPHLAALVADVRAQLRELIRPGFIAEAGVARLGDLDRYLRAVEMRLDKAPAALARDAESLRTVDAAEARYADLLHGLRPRQRGSADVVAIGWMIEELRVSLFAQTLGTAYPVSLQRISRAIDEAAGRANGGQ